MTNGTRGAFFEGRSSWRRDRGLSLSLCPSDRKDLLGEGRRRLSEWALRQRRVLCGPGQRLRLCLPFGWVERHTHRERDHWCVAWPEVFLPTTWIIGALRLNRGNPTSPPLGARELNQTHKAKVFHDLLIKKRVFIVIIFLLIHTHTRFLLFQYKKTVWLEKWRRSRCSSASQMS